VTPIVTEFLDLHPAIQVELGLADRNLDMIDEDLHAAIRIGPLPDSRLVVRRVGEVRRLLVAAPAYLERSAALKRPADLARHDTIASAATGFGLAWHFSMITPADSRRRILKRSPSAVPEALEPDDFRWNRKAIPPEV
jgi:DNA-binding transcriptional LysR family regulator